LSGDLSVASDGREAELRGSGTEFEASVGGAMEVGGTFRSTTDASGMVSESLGLAVELLASNATSILYLPMPTTMEFLDASTTMIL
jgi:hypothetical protein